MQILKKRELSRKSELKEYWGQVLWSEPPIVAGVFCGRRQGCWNETTGENRKLRVCSECEEAEGSGRHRAGSSWGIQQRQPASGTGWIPHGSPAHRWRKPLLLEEPLPGVLHISTGQSLFQQQPAGPGPVAKSTVSIQFK